MERSEAFKTETARNEEERMPENVVLVETKNGRFRIAYGKHNREQKPEDTEGADALVLEGTGNYSTREGVEKILGNLEKIIQYRAILKKARENKRPVFLVDVSDADVVALLQLGLSAAEVVVGMGPLVSLAKDIIKEKRRFTRREFLKKSARSLLGFYFFSHMPETILMAGTKIDEKSASRAVARFLGDMNERIHPETTAIIHTLRNHLWAQKAKTIAGGFTFENRKPEVAIVVGAAHHGVEAALRKEDAERAALIDKLLRVPGLQKTREKIATIARFDFDEGAGRWAWQTFKDPILAPLEQK